MPTTDKNSAMDNDTAIVIDTAENNNPAAASKEPGKDHLTKLPAELLFKILSNLSAPHANISNATGLHYKVIDGPELIAGHPFNMLSFCSYRLSKVVEAHCHKLLKDNQAITKFRGLSKKRMCSNGGYETVESYRGRWFKFSSRKCAFCGRQTPRAAIFNCLIKCCKHCDDKEWPPKITKARCSSANMI